MLLQQSSTSKGSTNSLPLITALRFPSMKAEVAYKSVLRELVKVIPRSRMFEVPTLISSVGRLASDTRPIRQLSNKWRTRDKLSAAFSFKNERI